MKDRLTRRDLLKILGVTGGAAALTAFTKEPSEAIPTKSFRLTLINMSGDDVSINLEGSPITQAYYYFILPCGTDNAPAIKVQTVMSDTYSCTSRQCGGTKTDRTLVIAGNTRLIFTPCDPFPNSFCSRRSGRDGKNDYYFSPDYQPWH